MEPYNFFDEYFSVSTAEGVPFMGKKWAILDTLSTTMKMVEKPSTRGSSTMKSIEIIFQGLSGTGNGFSKPQSFTLLFLLWEQVVQDST